MKKPNITEGEWSISASGHAEFKLCVIAPDGGSVCHITRWTEHKDNAQAISAVPDLLKSGLKIYNRCTPVLGKNVLLPEFEEQIKELGEALKKAGCYE